jgi:hypothetical protein
MLLNTYIFRTKRLNQGFKKEKKTRIIFQKGFFRKVSMSDAYRWQKMVLNIRF